MKPLYRVTAERAWTGDPWGNEWRLSWVVYKTDEAQTPFSVYTDDGVGIGGQPHGKLGGNGDFEGSFADFSQACRHADQRAAEADRRGF